MGDRHEKALHVPSDYAHEAGLVIGQCCVDGKINEIGVT
jgi:hypothetical protein